ncbi:hypothetical protein K3179_05630 [Qipengyuania sp. GH38]|uniref:hypothetical protein n=1 Tax=Qipengyuania intermedia TaxID=2867244 RepID=UPI001C88B236|nr:hypothetical protein [Qipengyuania intermedia]MBX7514029.1 hypothetical protein [Qipengyuania intermedia]
MIAGTVDWSGAQPDRAKAVLDAVSLYEKTAPQTHRRGGLFFAVSTRDSIASAHRVDTAFSGWIDNTDELARRFSGDPDSPAALYSAALAQLGDRADEAIIGCYAAISRLPDGTLRLSRSPWSAPPLYYHAAEERCVASPLLRALFAADAPREPDFERMVDELAYDWRSGEEEAWYKGIRMVPLGATVHVEGAEHRTRRWYSLPAPLADADFDADTAALRARELLDEAAGKALEWATKPAVTLSGGLDSPLVATSLLQALPEGRHLPAITFVPDARWDGTAPEGTIGDESELVGKLVAQNPRLDWHLADHDIGPPDRSAREMFAASEVFAPGLANVGMYHGVYRKARELGCDSLLTADLGNATFSDAGRYAYCEYAAPGRLGQLVRLLKNRPGDGRSLSRKFMALTVLPRLPRPIRRALRTLVHPGRADMVALLTPLSGDARKRQAARAEMRGTSSAWSDLTFDRNRKEAVERELRDADGPAFDVDLAFEQLYGVRKRDVSAYRPLIEFCLSLPARAFAWDGEERRLARLMGIGRLPEAIRTNRKHGLHNIDWHARMTGEREEMRRVLETARSHRVLGEMLDIDRMIALVDDWPERPSHDIDTDWPRILALPRAILAARFIGHLENRNDL